MTEGQRDRKNDRGTKRQEKLPRDKDRKNDQTYTQLNFGLRDFMGLAQFSHRLKLSYSQYINE